MIQYDTLQYNIICLASEWRNYIFTQHILHIIYVLQRLKLAESYFSISATQDK